MEILQTTKYEIFSFLEGNRPINAANLRNITESMRVKLLVNPIKVNSQMQVIDGQHRFMSAKLLGLPIYYFVDDSCDIDDVKQHNTTSKKWDNKDFLHLYCTQGLRHYLRFRYFSLQFPMFDITILMIILTGKSTNGDNNARFRNGEFKITNYVESKQIADELMALKDISPIKKRNFVLAYIAISGNVNYSHDRLLRKMELCGKLLKGCATVAQYREVLNEIYNFKAKDRVNLNI